MEDGLRLGLGSSALLKNPYAKTLPLIAKQKAIVRPKPSSKTIPGWLSDRKTNTENPNKEK